LYIAAYYTRAKPDVMFGCILAVRSIVLVLSCVTACWFCTGSCGGLTATVINKDYYTILAATCVCLSALKMTGDQKLVKICVMCYSEL